MHRADELLGLSKKSFKDATGFLFRKRMLKLEDERVSLTPKEEWAANAMDDLNKVLDKSSDWKEKKNTYSGDGIGLDWERGGVRGGAGRGRGRGGKSIWPQKRDSGGPRDFDGAPRDFAGGGRDFGSGARDFGGRRDFGSDRRDSRDGNRRDLGDNGRDSRDSSRLVVKKRQDEVGWGSFVPDGDDDYDSPAARRDINSREDAGEPSFTQDKVCVCVFCMHVHFFGHAQCFALFA